VGLGLVLLMSWGLRRSARVRWARETAVPEITRLVAKGGGKAAYDLALQAELVIPKDPALLKLWPEISLEIAVHTNPTGADVYMKPYRADERSWRYVGPSPVEHLKIPFGVMRWKASKQGFDTAEVLSDTLEGMKQLLLPSTGSTLNISLTANGTIPEGMVRIPGGSVQVLISGKRGTASVRTGGPEEPRRQVPRKIDDG
jgi:hypothetical protein